MLNFGGDIINIYLAGCISSYYNENEYYKATQWRKNIIKKLKDCNEKTNKHQFQCFDPTVNFMTNVKTANNKTVVHQNNYYLDNCDMLIINLENLKESPGTLYELFYYGIHNKPVIAFGYSQLTCNPHISECITVNLDNLDEVVDYLTSYYIQ